MIGSRHRTSTLLPDLEAEKLVDAIKKLEATDSDEHLWEEIWRSPFAPCYITHNITTFCHVVHKAQSQLCPPLYLNKIYGFMVKRLRHDSNRKKVFTMVTEVVLEGLLPHLKDRPAAKDIIAHLILSRDHMGLLEANLIANMKNYTSVLVSKLSLWDIQVVMVFLEELKVRLSPKNRNRLVLNLYLRIHNDKLGRMEALLDFITSNRFYNLREDQEQGNKIHDHLIEALERLGDEEYCRLAVKVLQLNHGIVKLDKAISNHNDQLLAQLFRSYQKVGQLPILFEALLGNGNHVLGDESRDTLAEISSSLTETMTLKLISLLKSSISDQKRRLPCECLSVILFRQSYYTNTDILQTLVDISELIGNARGEYVENLKEYFCQTLNYNLIPEPYSTQIQSQLNTTDLDVIAVRVQKIGASDNPSDEVDAILSEGYHASDMIPHLHLFYEHLLTDHLLTISRLLLKDVPKLIPCLLASPIFGNMTSLHSVLMSCILEDLISEIRSRDPACDITLATARDIVSCYVVEGREISNGFHDCEIELLFRCIRHIPLLPGCHLKLCTVATLMCVAKPDMVGGELRTLCKSHQGVLSLPIVHGTSAGHFLKKMALISPSSPLSGGGIGEFVVAYVSEALPLTSVHLEEFFSSISVTTHPHLLSLLLSQVLVPRSSIPLDRYRNCLAVIRTAVTREMERVRDSSHHLQLIRIHLMLSRVLGMPGDGTTYHDVIISSLKRPDISKDTRIKLLDTYLESVGEEEVRVEGVVNCLMESDLFETQDVSLKSKNRMFIRKLFEEVGQVRAKNILITVSPSVEEVEDLSNISIIPLELIPKLLPKLSKRQVLEALHQSACSRSSSGDQSDLSKSSGSQSQSYSLLRSECLLSMAHAAYPLHLFNMVLNQLFTDLSSPSYTSNPNTLANVARALEVVTRQRTAARHHCPYMVMTLLEHVSGSGSPGLVSDVVPLLHLLFTACSDHALRFLTARLRPGAKQLFLQLHQTFLDNVKFQGKV